MIRIRKVILLASTKLRTRRIRLVILLTTMSVLFAGLVFIACVTTGAVSSLEKFGKEGFGSRYLVASTPITHSPYNDTSLIQQVTPLQQQLVAKKKALAKKLGIAYDATNDTSLYYTTQQNGPSGSGTQQILTGSSLAVAALNDQDATTPGLSFSDFSIRAQKAGATKLYRATTNATLNQNPGSQNGTVAILVDGKESYASSNGSQQVYNPTGVQSIQTLGWKQMSSELLQPFLLSGQTTQVGQDGSVPVIAPFSAAEQMLGLHPELSSASASQKVQHLIQVRQQIAGKTVELCYRNYASETLLQKAISQQATIAANKGKSGYTLPHLLYNLPGQACGATTIKSDNRTADEKQADAAQDQFDQVAGAIAPADQGIVTLRIVGLNQDVNTGVGGLSATGILSNLLDSTIGYGWFSPASAFTVESLASQAQNGLIDQQPLNTQQYYAEFPTLEAANNFIKQTNCTVDSSYKNASGYMTYDPNRQLTACGAQHTPYSSVAYGNNAGAITSFKHNIWKVLRFLLLGIVVVAVIVMAGTFGKVIADSRRETAVFRALGASRYDIAQIYLTYTFFVGTLVALLSVAVGALAAEMVSAHFGPGLSVNAVLVYNARNPHEQFSLLGINGVYLLAIVILVWVVALASACIPLAANMRRNPIRDMREE